ncbi:ABC-three component system protein [Roseococcus sp.]|uniref:ABC-three component system protein n=1 Tax=Roseococcus sp. TaxID=2109646 RepID=UPI003BAC6B75
MTRLAQMSPEDFERLILEWATEFLPTQVGVDQVQQRGGAGDKGRDVLVWLDPSDVTPRRWRLYQCKRYATTLGFGVAAVEIAKVLHYTHNGDYTVPKQYWFVTHKGLTNDFQDQIDDPAKLKKAMMDGWDEYCAGKITSTAIIKLEGAFRQHVEDFNFSIFKAKQPLELIAEHRKTSYHRLIFGDPLVDRPPPPTPPSQAAAIENGYILQLFAVIGKELDIGVAGETDFAYSSQMSLLFKRSRITFYSAEGLRQLARDQMSDAAYFDTFLDGYAEGLFHAYTDPQIEGIRRLRATVLAAQSLQLAGHLLFNIAEPLDKEGVCHHLANANRITWCEP